jgi:ATP-dependent Clp protease protease subunit
MDSIVPPENDNISRLLQDRIIFLDSEIVPSIASKIVSQLFCLDKEDSTKPIELWIMSPGGSVESFFAIYDMMNFIKSPIKTVCVGEACSAAAMLLAAGTKGMRFLMPNSRVMIHQIQMDDIGGSNAEIEIETKELKQIQNSLTELLSRHTGKAKSKINRDTKMDKYLSAKDAIAYGLADEILPSNK